MALFRRFYDALIFGFAGLSGISILLIFMLVIYDVTVRTLGFKPPALTSATVEYLLLYFTLFAAPYLVRKKGHVYIDALTARLTGKPRWTIEKFCYLLSIVTCLLFAYIGLDLLLEAIEDGLFDERSVDMPMWSLYAPIPIGFFLTACEFGRCLIGIDRFYLDRTVARDAA